MTKIPDNVFPWLWEPYKNTDPNFITKAELQIQSLCIFCIRLWSNTPVITLNILATNQNSPQNSPTASEVLACASIFMLLIFTSWQSEPSASSKLRSHRLPMKLHEDCRGETVWENAFSADGQKKDLSYACLNESLHSFDINITFLEKNSCINIQIAKLQKLSTVWLHMHKYQKSHQLKAKTLYTAWGVHCRHTSIWTSTMHDNKNNPI